VTPAILRPSRTNLRSEPSDARRIERRSTVLHDEREPHGALLPLRSLHRAPATTASTARVAGQGPPTRSASARFLAETRGEAA
jgi:hypothetical protein